VSVNWFKCNSCGRSYKYKRSLYNHLKFECGVQQKFSCNICFKKFARRGNLRSHLGIIHQIVEEYNN